MHLSFVSASSPRSAPERVLKAPPSFAVRSSGAHPTNANPLAVMSENGRGVLLTVDEVDVAVEVGGFRELKELDIELEPIVSVDCTVFLWLPVDEAVDDEMVEVVEVVPLPPLGTKTSVTLMQNLLGSDSDQCVSRRIKYPGLYHFESEIAAKLTSVSRWVVPEFMSIIESRSDTNPSSSGVVLPSHKGQFDLNCIRFRITSPCWLK